MGAQPTMAVKRDVIMIPVTAANDFSKPADLGKAVTLAGEWATNGREAIGILLQNVDSGDEAAVGVFGSLPYFARNVISAGYVLQVTTSGEFIAGAAATIIVGKAMGSQHANNANTSSGALSSGFFNAFGTGPLLHATSAGALV